MNFDKIKIFEGKKKIGIILIHGWTANPRQLYVLAKMLNDVGYWVFIPLLSGHGTSPEELEEMKWQVWLEDVIKSIDFTEKKYNFDQTFLGGISLGGNLSLLASLKRKVDGVFLLGTPFHIKNHFWVWSGSKIMLFFKKYVIKKYPKDTALNIPKNHSYNRFPVRSGRECLKAIRSSALKLNKVKTPLLIVQTNSDYLVAKYSPWIIFNRAKSKIKKLQWIQSKHNSHTLTREETKDFFSVIHNFIKEIEIK
ncbi:MAG: alpha/beta fold hydrolase [Patescibacteria group bacterium]|jgi:carboxylesterase|nr:alpha/beta fold hydrolase [Patescibacteria group bacterium]